MRIHPVASARDRRRFLETAATLYAGSGFWVRPLDRDVETVFHASTNPAAHRGRSARWLLLTDTDETVGRIAAFIDPEYEGGSVGGIGLFECINDHNAAAQLFNTAKGWLARRGIHIIDGPINFGERDRWWGLLTDGYGQRPLFRMNYHPPYYQDLFERYGFSTHLQQYCYQADLYGPIPQGVMRQHARLNANPDYTVQPFSRRNATRFAADFTDIYNAAWAAHDGSKQISIATTTQLLREMKPVMDNDLVWFAYHQGRPIAVWIGLPDLNPVLGTSGRIGPREMMRLVQTRKGHRKVDVIGTAFGVIPEYQRSGVAGFLIGEAIPHIRATGRYVNYQMQWIGDFNTPMLGLIQAIGALKTRTFRTYRLDASPTPNMEPDS